MRPRLGALVVGVALLTGCATLRNKLLHGVGPDYERPPVVTPPQYRGFLGPPDAASLAELPWWSLFGDPVLKSLIKEAIENHYDLQTAVARIEESRALVGVAASQFYPQVAYQAEAARQREFIPPIFGLGLPTELSVQ